MTTVAYLESSLVEVVPGEEAVCLLGIRNTAPIVESYTLEILGEVAQWSVVEPAEVSIYPDTEVSVAIRFQPPRSAYPIAGDISYGVRVTPTERPEDQIVPEAVVRVLPFQDTTAEIVPRTSSGRWWARHDVAIDNRGNVPVEVAVSGTDPDGRLVITPKPNALAIGPGNAAFTKVTARSRKLRWRGQPITQPFQVLVAPKDAPPVPLDAATLQNPVVPRGTARLLALLLVLALVGAGLWFGLLQPVVKSAAKEAVSEPIAQLEEQQSKLDNQINGPSGLAQNPPGGASPTMPMPSAALPPASPSSTPSASPIPPAAPASPAASPAPTGAIPVGATSFNHIARNFGNAGVTSSASYTTPAGKVLVLTDFYLQNPQGDAGKLELLVDGTPFFTWSLANFRDLDYHAVSPIELPAGKTVVARLTCVKPGPALAGYSSAQCRVWALLSGYQTAKPSPTPRP